MSTISLVLLFPLFFCSLLRRFSPQQLFSIDANGPVMPCHSFRATTVGRSCDCRKVVGRGYLLLKPAPIPPHKCLFFFPAGDSPFAASLLEAVSSTVLNVFFPIWNVVSQVPSIRALLTTALHMCMVPLLGTCWDNFAVWFA